jgi:hypothetical protein
LQEKLVGLLPDQCTFPLKRRDIMAGVKYYLRQSNALLSHAQSITDPQLKARYRMMAQQYSDMASESAGEPEEVASETDDRQGPPRNYRL